MRNMIRVAIDGTASAGKGSIAKGLSRKMGVAYVDTGSMYRALALMLIRKSKSLNDFEAIKKELTVFNFRFSWQDEQRCIWLNGEDISSEIRTEDVGQGASIVSAHALVRDRLSEIQKKIAQERSVVMDGRDISTVIIPNAELKVFVDADIWVRGKRRQAELQGKGIALSLEQVVQDLKERDYRDMNRAIAPLKKDPEARVLDTTNLTIEEGIRTLEGWVREVSGVG